MRCCTGLRPGPRWRADSAPPTPSWTGLRKGLKGEEMGTGKGGKDERRGEEDKSRGQEVSRGTMLTHSPKQNLNAP